MTEVTESRFVSAGESTSMEAHPRIVWACDPNAEGHAEQRALLAKQLGASETLAKPFTREELLQAVNHTLR